MNSPKQLLTTLNWRYATKQFDADKKIDEDTMRTLTEALRLSPSSFGLQPWKFIVISNSELKAALRPHSWDQAQITDCSHLVVLCTKKSLTPEYVEHYIETIAQTRKVATTNLEDYKQMMLGSIAQRNVQEWNTKQVYISNGFLLLAAAELGIDACPMEGFAANEYDEVLGLTGTDFTSSVVTALGYRSSADSYAMLPKVRFSAKEVIEIRA